MKESAIIWLTIDQVADRLQLKRSSTYKCLPALDTVQLGRGQRVTEASLTRLQLKAQEIGLWPAVAELSHAKQTPLPPSPAATTATARSTSAKTGAGSRKSRSATTRAASAGYLHLIVR